MKLKDVANPLFLSSCALGLNLVATPASADTTSITTDLCQTETAIFKDNEEKSWLKVKAFTKDMLPITFDLHLELELYGTVNGYDKASCANITNQIYDMAANSYNSQIITFKYEDLPENTATFPSQIIHKLNKLLASMMPRDSSALISSLEIQNVEAPGLNAKSARDLLQGKIKFDYSGTEDPVHGTALSWDFKPVTYDIKMDYQEKRDAYYNLGPNKEGIRRRTMVFLHNHIEEQILKRPASCIKGDMKYILANSFINATKDNFINELVNLHELHIENMQISKKATPQARKNSHPYEPVCITELENLIKRQKPN